MSLGAPRQVMANDPDIVDRTIYFDLRLASNATLVATAEAAGQPQISTNYGAYVDAGISTLTAIDATHGKYSAVLTQASIANVGTYIRTRYKSANTVETPGTHVFTVVDDPGEDHVANITASVIAGLTGNIGVIVIPTTSQQLTLADAIEFCRSALRDVTQDSFKTTDIREAIKMLTADFINNTPVSDTVGTVAATIDDPELDLSGLAGFSAERFKRAQIGFGSPLKFDDYNSVSRKLDASDGSSEPEVIAFDTSTTAYLAPRPEEAYSIKVKYSLAANELSSDTDTIQIPAQYLRPALWWGVPALLRGAGQEGDEGDRGWRRYRDIVRKLSDVGVANRGNFVMDRSRFN